MRISKLAGSAADGLLEERQRFLYLFVELVGHGQGDPVRGGWAFRICLLQAGNRVGVLVIAQHQFARMFLHGGIVGKFAIDGQRFRNLSVPLVKIGQFEERIAVTGVQFSSIPEMWSGIGSIFAGAPVRAPDPIPRQPI